jgi:hypothetical protein
MNAKQIFGLFTNVVEWAFSEVELPLSHVLGRVSNT